MLKQTSKNFRKEFLTEFTKELIRATGTYKQVFIKREVKEIEKERKSPLEILPKKEVKEAVREKLEKDSEKFSRLKEAEEVFSGFQDKRLPERKRITPLKIREPMLPETVRGFMPFSTTEQINLEKLNPLVRDPLVKVIECNGPDEIIIVMGAMGRKPTNITLRKEQIEEIIDRFSEASKIPVEEGFYKVVYGNLVLSAIVSEIIGSKFIIRKMR